MKYWFFDGNDVIGPFEPRELAVRSGFSVAASLVCPENFSEDEDSWKIAASFTDFGPDALSSGSAVSAPVTSSAQDAETSTEEETALFDKEMDTFLKNPSILAGTAAPAPEGPGLEIPKKPAKPGPIEDYFNNINGDDLGDILGIPDPNENSDMNLPRVLEEKFENTAPPADKEIDSVELNESEEEPENETDAFVSVQPKKQTVKREDAAASVPMSLAQEDDLLVELPQKTVFPESETSARAPEQTPAPESVAASKLQDKPQDNPPEKSAAEKPALAEEPEPVFSSGPAVAPESESAHTAAQRAAPGLTDGAEPEASADSRSGPACGPAPLEEEKLSTCTLPLIGERDNFVSLPVMPEDGAPFPADEPAAAQDFSPAPFAATERESACAAAQKTAPDFADGAQRPVSENTAATPAVSEPEELVRVPSGQNGPEPARDIVHEEPSSAPAVQELTEPLKTAPVEPRLNQIKPKLNQTPEIEHFLTSQKAAIRGARNRKANAMLWVLSALLAAGVIFMLLRFFGRGEGRTEASAPQAAFAPAKPAAPQTADSARGALDNVTVPPPIPLSPADKALAAVQNHQLSEGKGTVASYFDRIYKTQLSQGYTGGWSAEPLHKNTYIVKYRLSKTRMEPIVYVFQADAAQGRLTGALNNVALDLVGKI